MAEDNSNPINTTGDGLPPKRGRGRPTKAEQLARKRQALEQKGEALKSADTLESAKNDINIAELEQELHDQQGFSSVKTQPNNEPVNNTQQVNNTQSTVNTNQEGVNQTQGAAGENIEEPNYPQDDLSSEYTDFSEIIPEADPDPLQESVIKRGYTQQSSVGGQQTQQQGTQNTQTGAQQQAGTTQNTTTTKPVEEVIPEVATPLNNAPPDPNANSGVSGNNNNNQQGGNNTSKNSFNDKLEDLSPGQKRKAAEKAADAMLLAYGQILPILPKKFSSVSIRKLETLEIQDKITLSMPIMEDGTTIKEYFEGINSQVDDTFVVTKEMKDEVREPLIEVLLENNVALTPTQRLLMAVGGHVMAMGMATLEFASQNKAALREFKRFHEETRKQRTDAAQAEAEKKVSQQTTTQTKTEQPKQEENVRANTVNTTKEEKVVYKEEFKEEDKLNMDDILENGKGGITIDGEPQD